MFGLGKKEWEPAVATIVLVNIKKVSGDGLTPTREWGADVRKATQREISKRSTASEFLLTLAG